MNTDKAQKTKETMKNTVKAQSQTWWIIIAAVIAIIVAISIIIWFRSSGEKAVGGLGENIDKLKDTDNDGVADLFDRCANTAAGVEVNSRGCPEIEPPTLEG